MISPNGLNQASSVHLEESEIDFHRNDNQINYLSNLNFSPEFYYLFQALERSVAGRIEGRYRRRLGHVNIIDIKGVSGRVDNLDLDDIVTLDTPIRFADKFIIVKKVDVRGTIRASRVTSNHPLSVIDLIQFDKYRIPITGLRAPIRLNNLALASTNRASYTQCHMLNEIRFNEFINSIMSLTRPQIVDSSLQFLTPVNLEGIVKTEYPLDGINELNRSANGHEDVRFPCDDGLQCNSVIIKIPCYLIIDLLFY